MKQLNHKLKSFLLAIFLMTTAGLLHAQVGINTESPHQSSVLDVQSPTNNQGVLLPRMTTAQKQAITNPAVGLLVYDTDSKCISQNVGTEADPSWVCLSAKDNQSKFFYMPSIAIDASAEVEGQTINLYDRYKTQFNAPMAVSASAPASIPYFPAATDLYYYITSYDNTVIKINSLNASGVLNYDIIAEAPFASFMNVVMVVK